jgi:glutathione peroxidase
MSRFVNKKVMIVNTASFCQYTPQYADLELLYKLYNQYGFEIVGFPCNDFGAQDPNSDSLINVFCNSTYSVTFTMMSKVKVATGDTAPVYKWLQRANLNGKQNVSVAWNFGKFLINESGNWVKYYPSSVLPTDTAITNWILSPSSNLGINNTPFEANLLEITSSNPADKSINFRLKRLNAPCSLTIFSADGKRMFADRSPLLQEGVISCDVSSFEPGLYVAEIATGESIARKKVVIAH